MLSLPAEKLDTEISSLAFALAINMWEMFTFICAQTYTNKRLFFLCKSCPRAFGTFPRAQIAQRPNVDVLGVARTRSYTDWRGSDGCHLRKLQTFWYLF